MRAEEIISRNLIENRLHNYLAEENVITEVDALELLTPNRFDLAIKLSYLTRRTISPMFAEYCYSEHIKAFGMGTFREPEKKHKNSLTAFLADFEEIEKSIKECGFDSSVSLIPLAKDGSILNGAHRVAAAIFLQRKVATIKLDVDPPAYGYSFFAERLLPWEILNVGVSEFVRLKDEARLAVIWPVAESRTIESIEEHHIPNRILELKFKFSLKELAGFIRQVYKDEVWLGSPKTRYDGAFNKASNCYKNSGLTTVVIFVPETGQDLVKTKEEVRAKINLGKHCIHITDGKEDTKEIINFILNKNSIEFLHLERHERFDDKDKKMVFLRNKISELKISVDDVAVDSGMVMEIFGLRKANDIDVLLRGTVSEMPLSNAGIGIHNAEYIDQHIDPLEILENPKNHFWYNGIKIVALQCVRDFKHKRREVKDRNDIEMIDVALQSEKKFYLQARIEMKQKLLFLRMRLRKVLRKVVVGSLKRAGLFGFVKKILRRS